MSDPKFEDGKWLVPKDPNDIRFYRFDFEIDLTNAGTTPHVSRPPVVICGGVSLATHPDGVPNVAVDGTAVTVYLGGFDETDGALNFCTVRLHCTNGEQIDGTMWYVREDH